MRLEGPFRWIDFGRARVSRRTHSQLVSFTSAKLSSNVERKIIRI
jgi:hypothetical protein